MAEIIAQFDPTQERELRALLGNMAHKLPLIQMRAVNRTVKTGKSKTSQRAREILTVKKKSVDDRLRISKRATQQSPSARIDVSGKPPGLISFQGARQSKKKGVTVRVRKNSSREVHPHSFIAQGVGGLQVFERASKQNRKKRAKAGQERVARLPIVRSVGPAVSQVIINEPGVEEKVQADIFDTLEKNTLSQIDRVLAGKG